MPSLEIQLVPQDGGAVSVTARNDDRSSSHVVPAETMQAVQAQVAALMAGFESGYRPLVDPVTLSEVGRRLHEVFLAPLDGVVSGADARRLLFTSQDPDCLNLPWELLPGADGQFLAADAASVIRRARQAPLPEAARPLAAPPLRILFTACAPVDQKGLDYEKEEEAILQIVHKLGDKVHLEIAEAGSFEELRELITEYQPHIVHLSGHGLVKDGVGTFAFEDERGHTDSRDAREMAAQLFAGQGVRLVFMNGCQTAQSAVAGICQTLTASGDVPLALGWAASIADDLATEFARVLFHELAAGQTVDHAVAAARAALFAKCRVCDGAVDLLDTSFALPQLHASDGSNALVDRSLPARNPDRPAVAYTLLGDDIRGLREGFVGRRRQLQRTRPALRNGEKTIVLLTGIGGAGKSTLATRLANRCAREGYTVVALKARKEESAQFCSRLLGELVVACVLLGREGDEEMLLDGKRPMATRLRLAIEVLNKTKILLVLDNLESLMPLPPARPEWEHEGVAAFFEALASRLTGQGRAILTCRYLPAGFYPERQANLAHEAMPDFTEADFFKYLRRHPRVMERIQHGNLPRDLIATFHRKLGATPRFVEQACAILATIDADSLAEQLGDLALPAEDMEENELWKLQQDYFRDLFLPSLYDTLSSDHRLALSRLSLAYEALPLDGVATVSGVDANLVPDFIERCLALSMLQRFGEKGETKLFSVYPLQREFFASEQRLSSEARRAAHSSAAIFFRECFERDREVDLRLAVVRGLHAALYHAIEADDLSGRIWAAVRLARPSLDRAEYVDALGLVEPCLAESRDPDLLQIAAACSLRTGAWQIASQLLAEEQQERKRISDRAGEASTWHQLATIDMNQGNYPPAREKLGKSLGIQQAIGDRAGESSTWHQLATIDMKEGDYPGARQKFSKSLTIKQMIGARASEAATWHNLATIDLDEGNYPAAREKFGKSLTIDQDFGDPAGEAATWYNLATIDVYEGNYPAAREKAERSLRIRQAVGDRAGEASTWSQLATIDLKEGNCPAAQEKLGKSLAMLQVIGDRVGEAQAIGHIGYIAFLTERPAIAAKCAAVAFLQLKSIGSAEKDIVWGNLITVASRLGLDQEAFDSLLREADELYQHDRGAELIRQVFEES